ncbi:MAG: HsdR family type I site-specific deoxyribonuclease [Candidatus Muirbacterium halophilum]|nr:HsdR family type I site-specific deoxyribonuclease [Candidatus Muirbacterium halophilum]MCK9474806.1 HsdR family type I site-specific deoxyribonuclease [Candidatus Muirbacterium halophilum]
MNDFKINEKHISQFPVLKLLVSLGFEFLSSSEIMKERQNRYSNVILENILSNQLKKINNITYKGRDYLFSEENIQSAIQKIKNVRYNGLVKTNEYIYDLLTLGTSLQQIVEGDSKSFNFNYIDWKNPERNCFHVAAEFVVERSKSNDTARPDIVLFVNGIPFCVIECKSPGMDVEDGVSQNIRNQGEDYIPKLFTYVQLVMSVNKNKALYATVGTNSKFWSVWKEIDDNSSDYEILNNLVNSPVDSSVIDSICGTIEMKKSDIVENRLVTEQDKAVFCLCRPERLVELAYKYTVYDSGIKKIARYQQYFVIKSTLERVKQYNNDGNRKGGIIWHTQGSGKSLTMVMLTRNLVFDPEIRDPRIVLVTDRDDLDRQLGNTFTACGLEARRATSGRNLLELVSECRAGIITTLIHKFEKAYSIDKYSDNSKDIFVLVDESHRTNFGTFSARMRQIFPNACYLGFTGTPLLKADKNNFHKFGNIIEPHYSIKQAVSDKAVVPLLYEGRHVEMTQNNKAVDMWFERHTQGLSDEQKADLKKKYARAEMLNKTEQVVYMRAFDISEHFRLNWQGTGFKAQLVAPNKVTAILYNRFLNEIGMVTSDVVISSPDMREGYDEVDAESNDDVVKFWQKMMRRFGDETEYNKQIINQFKNGDEPEIIIVVDKLLTGFDAPRNTVLYICRTLREHNLLQAIARVNRLYEGKEYGFIVDYVSILGELDKALTMYDVFENYDQNDIEGTLYSIHTEIDRLPQKHSELLDIFKTVKNSKDEEEYELLLGDNEKREDFYAKLSDYTKVLSIALSSENFLNEISDRELNNYKLDLKRFCSLRESVKRRYAEAVDFKEYEYKIKKLLDTHIQADEVKILNKPVNIFDNTEFDAVKDGRGIYGKDKSAASRADSIAHATDKTITEKWDEDPAFYAKFSELIQKVIDDFRQQRISDLEYLEKVGEIRNKVVNKIHDDVPDQLKDSEDSMAFYGILFPHFQKYIYHGQTLEKICSEAAISINRIIKDNQKVHFWQDNDAQKQVMNEIDDYLYDEIKEKHRIDLKTDIMDSIIEETMKLARHRYSN